jgi:predicted nucleotidyltransferase
MEAKTKNEIRKKIKDFFDSKREIHFVYLFGSIVSKNVFRDIDIAIYMDTMPDLITQGKLQATLDNIFEYKMDLVILNDLPDKNPTFAHEIMTKGELLLNKDPGIHTDYKSKVFRYYFDTAYLRDQFEDAFKQRIKTGKFGERDYE